MKLIISESWINGQLVPHEGIANLFVNALPQAIIYQNLDNFGVAFVFADSDQVSSGNVRSFLLCKVIMFLVINSLITQDNKIAASLTLNAITSQMLSAIRTSSLERVISQPEDIYSILDSYIPNGQVIIANSQVYRCF